MYDGKQILMCEVNDVELYLSQYEQAFENLWKQYYKSVNITSRPHERQMKGYMPVRYWKFMPEKNDNN
jgi:probable DNA metabolism protein